MVWLFFTVSFSGNYIIMAYQKKAMPALSTISGLLLLYYKDIVVALIGLILSVYLFPQFYINKPAKKVRSFEFFLFSLCLLVTGLYLLNVFRLGQRNTPYFTSYYFQLRYLLPVDLLSCVLLQQAGTTFFLLDLNRSRFGAKTGYWLTVAIFAFFHLFCFLFMDPSLALFIIVSSVAGMSVLAKIRMDYNSVRAPVFIHYLFHITATYYFSLKSLLSFYPF
jgi:hypothetical protein